MKNKHRKMQRREVKTLVQYGKLESFSLSLNIFTAFSRLSVYLQKRSTDLPEITEEGTENHAGKSWPVCLCFILYRWYQQFFTTSVYSEVGKSKKFAVKSSKMFEKSLTCIPKSSERGKNEEINI